jgi:hypothetical protein
MEKLVKGLLKTKAFGKAMECPPVEPDKNRGNGGYCREYLAVFHTYTMRERE